MDDQEIRYNAVAMARTLSWLHFSDLHTNRPKTGWDAQEVLDLLVEDMTWVRDQPGVALPLRSPRGRLRLAQGVSPG